MCRRDRADLGVDNILLANNASAVDAAAAKARELGFAVCIIPPETAETSAEDVARNLVRRLRLEQSGGRHCVIWGGEPIVRLAAPEVRGDGGRNQQLVLTMLCDWKELPAAIRPRLCLLSGGTDGEDGPTDAAGAFVDQSVVNSVAPPRT